MRVPKLAGGPDREIRVLGGAAPLSSRKTGYLLRVAHMIPIIFPALRGRVGPPRDSTHWLGLPRYSVKRMGTIKFFQVSCNKTFKLTFANSRSVKSLIKSITNFLLLLLYLYYLCFLGLYLLFDF